MRIYPQLTAALNPVPLFILPLLEKFGLAQRRMTFMPGIGFMMQGYALQVLLVSVIAGKSAQDSPAGFQLAGH
jgi:hypothetical protein